jgi:glycosyltransferase involved in cell wall biosynthesis
MLALRRQDILLVTCVLPTSLILIEWANRLLRRRGVHVVLHGDIEGIFTSSRQSWLSIGFWAKSWLRLRRPHSGISLVVLDDFIKSRLISAAPEKLNDANIFVVQLPVTPSDTEYEIAAPPTVGFLGYRTQIKSFETFAGLPRVLTAFRFVAIGGGRIEDLGAGTSERLAGKDGYLAEIARCSVACFPYTAGYTASLSASALDALATGVQILALDRPFFAELSAYFGDDVVRVVSHLDEIPEALSRLLQSPAANSRSQRLQKVANSKYGVLAVQRSFEHMLAPV